MVGRMTIEIQKCIVSVLILKGQKCSGCEYSSCRRECECLAKYAKITVTLTIVNASVILVSVLLLIISLF